MGFKKIASKTNMLTWPLDRRTLLLNSFSGPIGHLLGTGGFVNPCKPGKQQKYPSTQGFQLLLPDVATGAAFLHARLLFQFMFIFCWNRVDSCWACF